MGILRKSLSVAGREIRALMAFLYAISQAGGRRVSDMDSLDTYLLT